MYKIAHNGTLSLKPYLIILDYIEHHLMLSSAIKNRKAII